MLTQLAKVAVAQGASEAVMEAAGGTLVVALFNSGVECSGNGYGREAVTGVDDAVEIDGGTGAACSVTETATFSASGGSIVYDEVRIYASNGTQQLASISQAGTIAAGTSEELDVRFTIPAVNSDVAEGLVSSTKTAEATMATALGTDTLILEEADIRAWYATQDRRSETYEIEAGQVVEGARGFQRAIVGTQELCEQPATDPGWYWPAYNAIVASKYASLRLTPTASCTISGGALATGSLEVASVPRDLPQGAVLMFKHNTTITPYYYVQLTANVSASAGTTTIPVRKIFADVAITTSFTGFWGGRYASQRASNVPTVSDLLVCAEPDSWFASSREYMSAGLKYATDGFHFNNSGIKGRNLKAHGIIGTGIRLSHAGSESTNTGTQGPWDNSWSFYDNLQADTCLTGIVVQGGDEKYGNMYASNCRDFGIMLAATANHVASAHGWGCQTGVGIVGSINCASLDGADSDFGVELHSWEGINSGRETKIANLTVYNNIYSGFRCSQDSVSIGQALIEANSNGTTSVDKLNMFGGDTAFTNWGAVLGSWSDYFSCPALKILTANTANGLNIGHNAGKTLTFVDIAGTIAKLSGAGTTYGLRVRAPLAASVLAMGVYGFTNGFYVDTGATLTGNRIVLRGPSATTIRWADGTTGTFGSHTVPTAVASANSVSILPY